MPGGEVGSREAVVAITLVDDPELRLTPALDTFVTTYLHTERRTFSDLTDGFVQATSSSRTTTSGPDMVRGRMV